MRLDVSQKSFDIIKCLLTNVYLEISYQRDRELNLPLKKRHLSDTAEIVRTALGEIGIKINPTKIELDNEGNFK